MSNFEELVSDLKHTPAPTGLAKLIDDIDIDIFLYDEYIMGFVSKFQAGRSINPNEIRVDDELGHRLERCIEKLYELRSYKNKVDKLAKSLIYLLGSTF